MPSLAALALLGGTVFVAWGLARWQGRRTADDALSGTVVEQLRAGAVATGVAVGALLAIAGTLSATPLHWSSAAAGALAAAAGVAVGRELDLGGETAYLVPSLRRTRTGTPGAISATAVVGVVVAAATVAAMAQSVRWVAPGDAGLVAIGSLVGALGERCVDRIAGRGPAARSLGVSVATLLAAAVSAALVILLP